MSYVKQLPRLYSALILGAGLAFTPLLVGAAFADPSQMTISGNQYGLTQSVDLDMNKSMIIDLPADVSDVIVSQPTVAGAIMRSTRRAIIQGVGAGDTNIIFLDANGRTISVLDATVGEVKSNVGNALQTTLARVLPSANIAVESVLLTAADGSATNRIVLSGSALSADDAAKALTIATQFAGGAENVASVINVVGSQQVMLQVTVSEVKRDVAKQLGIGLTGSLSAGGATFSLNNPTPISSANVATTGFNIGNLQINAAIHALETRGALHILAQPTLTAISGQPAEFLAGGEVPYYTYDPTTNTRNVTFKEYGVSLKFTPIVKDNGVIALTVDTSVSDPKSDGSLTKRQASTSVELSTGTTLAIGGLLQETSSQTIEQFPGLGNIPILGALFRSRDFQTQQTELVILVTPYLVNPTVAPPTLPTDASVPSSDAEAIFLGKLETQYGVGSNGGMRGSIKGSVGFVLD